VANVFQFVDWVAMESLRVLMNKCVVVQFANTDYNKEFDREFAIGETVRVKLPQRFYVTDGLQYTPQPINRIYTTVTCNQIFGIHFEWDSIEKALNMERGEEWIKREYIDPAMKQIANEIDSRFALWAYQNTSNLVGVLGVDPNSMTTFQKARQRLIEQACTPGEWGMLIPPAVNTSLVPALASNFNPTSEISRQYKDGSMGKMSGFDWYESVNLYRHTAGTQAGAVTVNGANQQGNTLAITCTAGDTFNVGDVFSIANVNAVNPVSRRVVTLATPKQFVVTAPFVGLGGGNAADVLQISPAIFPPGSQYQNVDALPVNGAALTPFPGTASPNGLTSMQGLALDRNAFAIVGVKLEIPKACEMSSYARDPESGISVAFVRMFDPIQRKMVNRFDVLLGFGNLYPDNCAVRLACA
jgi:hypothetical protein